MSGTSDLSPGNSSSVIPSSSQWIVHKFGGTSVGDATSMRKCIDIIRPLVSNHRVAVVVSAMGGKPKVTDLLLDLVHAAAGCRSQEIEDKMKQIREKHQECVQSLLPSASCNEVAQRILSMIDKDLRDIGDLLRAVQLMRVAHEQILELVSGYGEIWSATIMTECLCRQGFNFRFLNAREVLFVSEKETVGTLVHWDESEAKLGRFLENLQTPSNQSSNDMELKNEPHLLITGYIASTLDGVATTLKRDGSDFTASIFGKMLRAKSITIWTDVSGVYSADPRRVPDAQIIPNVSYTEAIELAYFGAKVIHPKTMAPAILAKIPIFIRNTFNPECPGTKIFLPSTQLQSKHGISGNKSNSNDNNNDDYNPSSTTDEEPDSIERRERSVCGFTTVDNIALLNLEGTGMIGVPGIAHRLFGALKSGQIPVMFVAQASSEHSICFATKSQFVKLAKAVIEEAFYYEMKHGYVSDIRVIDDCSIIAAVGDSMNQVPGVSGLFLGALGDASINVLSISQGCDERNIAAVVHSIDATKALRAVHSAFWLSSLDVSIGIIGTGRVGSSLLQTILEQKDLLQKRFNLKITIRGVINSRKMLIGEDLSEILQNKLSIFTPSSQQTTTSLYVPPISPLRKTSSITTVNTPAGPTSPLPTPLGSAVVTVRKSCSNTSLQELASVMSDDHDVMDSNLDHFLEHISSGTTPHVILVDATTSYDIAEMHPMWLKSGCHVVTANKRAIASSLSLYNQVFSASRRSNRMYMSEVTIGASLPIRTTLNDILCSGDAIHSIVGMMSVSVSMILTDLCDEDSDDHDVEYERGATLEVPFRNPTVDGSLHSNSKNRSFTESVRQTFLQGLFEDDVFADLEGSEAAAKLMILARDMGYSLTMEDIEIEPLAKRRIIHSWANLTNEFAEEDKIYREKARQAKAKGCTLRYIQRIECNPPAELGKIYSNNGKNKSHIKASVKLEEVPLNSPHAMVKGALYHFSFHTERYAQNPLIVQGPLSDSVTTASGMLGDILRVARSMGAKDRGPDVLI